jgi:hypothetical protein
MRLRRVFALLTSVAMLHLTVAAGDAACATHGAGHHGATSRAASVDEHAMQMDGHVMPTTKTVESAAASSVRVAKSDVPPCEVPTQQQCCEALVDCSAVGAVKSERAVLASGVSSASRISEAAHDAPASFASAPEPPPPKP